jgi:hypothetical protein
MRKGAMMPNPSQSITPGASRRARTNERLRVAVRQQLMQRGYASVTIEGVAAAAGVAKTTIYRRWASKAEMVFELAIHQDAEVQPVDTGNLEDDIFVLAHRAVSLITSDLGRLVLPGLLAEMSSDAVLAERLRTIFIDAAKADIDAVFARALARGELHSDVNSKDFHAALLGIPYAHVHLLDNDNTDELVTRLTKQLLKLLPITD